MGVTATTETPRGSVDAPPDQSTPLIKWFSEIGIGGGKMVKNVPVAPEDRARFAITDDEILLLAHWGCIIEEHYTTKHGRPSPMDIEWAKACQPWRDCTSPDQGHDERRESSGSVFPLLSPQSLNSSTASPSAQTISRNSSSA